MKIKRISRRQCPFTGATFSVSLAGPEQWPDRNLDDYLKGPKLSKPERAERRRRRRQHQDARSLAPEPQPRLDIDDPERRRLQAEVLAVGRCQNPLCGTKYRLTMDHIVPLDLGGGNHRANLQCLCKACNKAKGRHIWAPGMPFPIAA